MYSIIDNLNNLNVILIEMRNHGEQLRNRLKLDLFTWIYGINITKLLLQSLLCTQIRLLSISPITLKFSCLFIVRKELSAWNDFLSFDSHPNSSHLQSQLKVVSTPPNLSKFPWPEIISPFYEFTQHLENSFGIGCIVLNGIQTMHVKVKCQIKLSLLRYLYAHLTLLETMYNHVFIP